MKTVLTAVIALMSATCLNAQDTKELVAEVKAHLETSMKQLRTYEWLETTVVYKDGEEKSRTQSRCYYGVDGKLYKVPTGAEKQDKAPRGIRGKIVENKKEEITEYIEKCVDKVQQYLPPKPDVLQAAYAGGRMAMQVVEPAKRFQLTFSDYLQKGDGLGVGLNKEKKMLTNVDVKTYVDKPEQTVNFHLNYGQLPDGTQYPQETVLDMPSKGLKISIKNDGYKKGTGN